MSIYRRAVWGSLLLSLVALPLSEAGAQERPPETEPRLVVDTLHGTALPDPYRWLEDPGSDEVAAWFLAQGAHAREVLDALPGRATLLDRMRAIADAAPPDVSLPRYAGGRWFYTMRRANEPVARGYVRDAWTGVERLLVDPASVAGGGETGVNTLETFRPSPDGRLVLYGVTTGGSESIILRVRDVASSRDVAGPIPRNHFPYGDPWSPDGRAFFYLQLRDVAPGAPDYYHGSRILRHRMGEAESDMSVFSAAAVGEDDALLAFLDIDARSDIALGILRTGVEQHSAFFVAPLGELIRGEPEWRSLFTLADSVVSVAVHGPDLYALTWKGSPRIVRTRLDDPDLSTAETLMADGDHRIQGMHLALDGLYVDAFVEGLNRVTRIPWGEGPVAIDIPPGSSVYQPPGAFQSLIQADELRSGVLLQLSSWTSVPRSYRYNPSTDSLEEFAVAPLGPFDRLKGHVVETGFATSHDGARVPFTFLRPERIGRDGSLPVLLVAYGAYGFPDVPQYVADWRPWYEAGGADVTCHVRGGGHYGDRWHRSGRKGTKPNSWLDFIACAEHLVREGYTSPERIVALGVSAGGITVGRAIIARPDLFAGAVIENGLLDLVRVERMPGGEQQTHEFGSVATEPGFRALHAMSAFHHVEAGASYPAILLAVALNDTRVSPWQSAKFAAALQAATSSGKPVLLRVEEEAGHMGGTPEGFRSLMADEYAFIMHQVGMPPYRPRSEERPEP